MWKYVAVISLFLFSCATKKAAISKIDTKIDSVVVEKKDSVAVQQNAIVVKEDSYEIVVAPIDTTKPIIIGEKPYFNATVKIKKVSKSMVDSSKMVVVKSEEKKAEVKKGEKKKERKVNKKRFNLWWLLLIPLSVLVIRRYLIK